MNVCVFAPKNVANVCNRTFGTGISRLSLKICLVCFTHRVSLTYRVKSAHKVKLTDKQLLQWMVPILLVMLIYLSTWTLSATPSAEVVCNRFMCYMFPLFGAFTPSPPKMLCATCCVCVHQIWIYLFCIRFQKSLFAFVSFYIIFLSLQIVDSNGLKFKQCVYNWWDHSLAIGEVLFLAWGIRVCYNVRNAESLYNEARMISYAIYNIALVNILMIAFQ